MMRKFLERLASRMSSGLHPDLTFEDLEVSKTKTDASPPAPERKTQEANAEHPDFDFEPDIARLTNENANSHDGLPAAIQLTVEPDDIFLPLVAEVDTLHSNVPHAQEDHDGIFEHTPDPLDFAMSLDELTVEEDSAPLDPDWDDYSVDALKNNTVQKIEPLDIFDFDISEFEAEFEAEPIPSESPTGRALRLDGAAADLVLALGAFPTTERRALHRRFRAILEDFPHHSSHLALHRLLAAGASLEEIEEAASLRHLWLEQPWLWGQKRRILRAWEVWRNPSQRLAFGWSAALRLVRIFGIVEAEQSLNDDWMQTWVELQRHKASDLADETAFFTYSEFLKQLSRSLLLSISEGVHEEPADQDGRMYIRDIQGQSVWRFERKLPQRDGELSLEPSRFRNHRDFDAAALEITFGLGGLRSATGVEKVSAGYQRTYVFAEQDCGLTSGAKVQLSAKTGHGRAKIVRLDANRSLVVLQVAHDHRRLLADCAALKGSTLKTAPNT